MAGTMRSPSRSQPAGPLEGRQAAGELFGDRGRRVLARRTASRTRAQRASVTCRYQPVALRTSYAASLNTVYLARGSQA